MDIELRCIFSNDSEIVASVHVYIIRKKDARLARKISVDDDGKENKGGATPKLSTLQYKCFSFFYIFLFFFPVVIP